MAEVLMNASLTVLLNASFSLKKTNQNQKQKQMQLVL